MLGINMLIIVVNISRTVFTYGVINDGNPTIDYNCGFNSSNDHSNNKHVHIKIARKHKLRMHEDTHLKETLPLLAINEFYCASAG